MSAKTHKAAVKRLRLTATGKVKRARMGKGHLLSGKSAKHRRRLRQPAIVTGAAARRLNAIIKHS